MKLYRSDVVDIAFVAADSLQVRHVAMVTWAPAGMGTGALAPPPTLPPYKL